MTEPYRPSSPVNDLGRFDALVRECRPQLEREARRWFGPEDAADVTQDALIDMGRRHTHIVGKEEFLKLGRAILHLKRIDLLRRMSRQIETVPLSDADADTVGCPPVHVEVLEAMVALGSLENPAYREALALKAYGLEDGEIAAIMGVPSTTVHNWINRGRKRAREIMDGEDVVS
jgi:DNA-directed RNA polymerase specialized sigma24 family protein